MKHGEMLNATSHALGIVSQLLAIGIEVGVIAGGFYIYKTITDDKKPAPEKVMEIPEGMKLVSIEEPKKTTFKEKWAKVKAIAKAVIE